MVATKLENGNKNRGRHCCFGVTGDGETPTTEPQGGEVGVGRRAWKNRSLATASNGAKVAKLAKQRPPSEEGHETTTAFGKYLKKSAAARSHKVERKSEIRRLARHNNILTSGRGMGENTGPGEKEGTQVQSLK